MSKNLKVWVEGTIMAALATALSFVPLQIGPSFSITVGGPVMVLYSLRRGFVPGTIACFLWGILHIPMGNADILSPVQGFLEYFIAFGFTGVAGLWATVTQKAVKDEKQGRATFHIIVASIAGNIARYFWHTIAGYYFWGQYAPEGWSPWFYSIVMNSVSGFATAVFTIVVLLVVLRTTPRLYTPVDLRLGY